MTHKFKKRLQKLLWTLGICLLLVVAVTYWYVPRLVIEIKNPIMYQPRVYAQSYEAVFPTGKTVELLSDDGIKLNGYLSYADTETPKGTIILLHGIRGGKEGYISLCQQLHAQGYHTFALDLRAHGESGGDFNTFGAKERYDVVKVVDYLQAEGLPNIGVWGRSLGGAIALQALAVDKRLTFGVIESTFSDFKTVVHDYTKLFVGIDNQLFTDFLVARAGAIGNFNPEIVKPKVSCTQITQPVYMSHGTADHRIDISYGKANFNALKSRHKVFEAIPNATHMNVWYIAGEAHFNKIMQFLATNVQPNS